MPMLAPPGRQGPPSKAQSPTRSPSIRSAVQCKEQNGLEVAPGALQWAKWHAGGEFARVLVVKNRSSEVIRFAHKLLPHGSAFSVDFPEPRRLSPGMSATVKVVFRPPQRVPYSEHLELLSGATSIFVPLSASLPASKLELPPAVDFGCVPVRAACSRRLPITNVGDAPLAFSWQVAAPFAVVPAAGQLAPQQTLACEVLFQPAEAATYWGTAACSLDNGELLTVQVGGMAKFPCMQLAADTVDLGSVVVGQAAEAGVRLANTSAVPAAFRVAHADGCQDGTISLQPTRGTLLPEEWLLLRVTFVPRATGTFSCQSFTLSAEGGNMLTLICQGTATGPALGLSTRLLAFGSVRSGQAPSRALYLQNASEVPLHFQWLGAQAGGGAFEVARPRGVIPPRSMTHTAVRFASAVPGNHWQRLVCLVKDSEPQAVDVLASCFDDSNRPPPLTIQHVQAALEQGDDGGALSCCWKLLFEGDGAGGPVTVSERLLDFGCCSMLSPAEPRSFQVTNTSPSKPMVVRLAIPAWQDPVPPHHAAGAAAAKQPPPQQQQQPVFTAFPESLELWPQASGTIRVAFRPARDGTYFSQTLVLVSSAKAVRSFRTVQPGSQVEPPWSIPILACGNTFASLRPEQAPKASLSTSRISFPPCRSGEAVHATLSVVNEGDTPVHFAFAAAHPGASSSSSSSSSSSRRAGSFTPAGGVWLSQHFALLPARGVLEPRSQRLVAVRFQPDSLAPTQLQLACTFNHSAASCAELLLSGTASEPHLAWDLPSSSRLFFRPTCVGATSQRVVTLRNTSSVALGWRWAFSRKLQDAVSATPESGVLRGHERAKVTITFAPLRQGSYDARAALLLLPPSQVAAAQDAGAALEDDAAADTSSRAASAGGGEKLILTVLAEATQGALCVEPPGVAFGAVRVGHVLSQRLTLINQSSGVLRYRVAVAADHQPGAEAGSSGVNTADAACEFSPAAQTVLPLTRMPIQPHQPAISTLAGTMEEDCEASCWVDAPEGTIGARSSKPLQLTLLPRRRGHYRLRLELHASSVVSSAAPPQPPGALRSLSAASSCAGSPVAAAAAAICCGTGSPAKQGSLVAARHGRSASASSAGTHTQLLPERLNRGQPEATSSDASHQHGSDCKPRSAGPAVTGPQGSSLGGGGGIRAVRSAGGISVAAAVAAAPCVAAAAAVKGLTRAVSPLSASGEPPLPKPPLTSVAVTADASFPSLLVTDVFCSGVPKQLAWQLLGLSQLNRELQAAVSAAELQAQLLADAGQLSDASAAELLPPFRLDLGAACVGGGPRDFWITLTNSGELPAAWELHSYDAPQVDLENWVEPAEPLTPAERARAFVVSRRVFEVLPRSSRAPLAAGVCQHVCLRFNPVAEGRYELPLFLRVADGKQLQLQLVGQAVAADAQLALTLRGAHSCMLAPAPIGELQPPLQQYTLRNGGPAPLRYALDASPLQALAAESYGVAVIQHAGGSPLEGTIAPGDVAAWNWLFAPVEARPYSVALPLRLGDAPPQPLVLHGRGYHPREHPEQAAASAEELEDSARHWQGWPGFSAHPCSSSSIAPAQLAADSPPPPPLTTAGPAAAAAAAGEMLPASGRTLLVQPEMLDLGVCLPASTSRQLLTLTNAAAAPLAFAWHLGVFDEHRSAVSGRLTITPAAGVLQPGNARVCQVAFEAGLTPQLFAGEVTCHATIIADSADRDGDGLQPAAHVGAAGLTMQQWRSLAGADGEGGAAARESQLDDGTQQQPQDGEEVLAQHPPRPAMPVFGRRLRQRLPLHLSMTEAICNRFDALKRQFQGTLAARTISGGGGGTAAAAAAGLQGRTCSGRLLQDGGQQLVTVTVQGAVLSKAHIGAGSYISSPEELQRARQLLPVAHLLPTSQQARPVSLLPPPGSLGLSVAADRAAVAVAVEAAAVPGEEEADSDTAEQCGSGFVSCPPPAAGTELSAAGAVLQELLTDVWADDDVAAALGSCLHRQPAAAGPLLLPAAAAGATAPPSPGGLQFAEWVLDSAVLGILQDAADEDAAVRCAAEEAAASGLTPA